MFQPSVFREERIEVMHKMMRQNPFASLVSLQDGEMVADHLPLVVHPELSEQGKLRGHLSRANPIGTKLDQSTDVLVIFQGPHHYVTPSWYPSKMEHDKVVPTWNYIVVHARGKVTLQQDPEWILAQLTELTERNELGRRAPWKVSDAPEEFIARQLRGIVGVEIEITALQGTWKVSQNKAVADSQGVSEGLRGEESDNALAMALCVEQRRRCTDGLGS
ncbi:FMN-binding negative transcriptional regulator [Marinobacterium jannaschii]|uniref:FMN-binding negative transcriptional regulator n=1 Tax=Marinobacterium jannaschii TaxID=64970 RepID=UPI00056B1342|nr:FMN-binding negative transcriptional regulator [Marinobacterium jannaschii]